MDKKYTIKTLSHALAMIMYKKCNKDREYICTNNLFLRAKSLSMDIDKIILRNKVYEK